jgi:hypothetical protein
MEIQPISISHQSRHEQGHAVIRKNPSGHVPTIHSDAFVDPTAIVCGKVIVHENVFIGP